jgi:DNA-binding NtrC family response regulator
MLEKSWIDMIGSVAKTRSVVVVDSDIRLLDQVAALLDGTHIVLATSDPHRAVMWLRNDLRISAVIVSQTLRGGSGLDLLIEAKRLRGNVRRILIANYEDLSSIIPGLHSGVVQRTISKPIDPRELVGLLRTAPPIHHVTADNISAARAS